MIVQSDRCVKSKCAAFWGNIPQPPKGTLTPLVPLSLRAYKGEGERRTEAGVGATHPRLPLVQYWGGGGGMPLSPTGEPSPPRETRGRLLGPLRGLCMTGLSTFESPSPSPVEGEGIGPPPMPLRGVMQGSPSRERERRADGVLAWVAGRVPMRGTPTGGREA